MAKGLFDLPEEILLKIIRHLSPISVGSLACTSKNWQRLTQDDQQWKQRVFDELTIYPALKPNETFKQYYLRIYQREGVRYPSRSYKFYLMGCKSERLFRNLKLPTNVLDEYLVEACEIGAEVWVKELLKKGANANFVGEHGYYLGSPAVLAINSGNVVLLKALLDHGLDINQIVSDPVDCKDSTLFHAALHSANPKGFLKVLFATTAQITVLSDVDKALIAQDRKYLYKLIEKGADINKKDRAGCTPLWWALMLDDSDGFKCLLELGASLDEVVDNESIFRVIMTKKKTGYLQTILQIYPNSDLNESWQNLNFEEENLLTKAIRNNLTEEVRLLLGHYDVSQRQSALLEAIGEGNLIITKMIIKTGIDINYIKTQIDNDLRNKHKSIYKKTPLILAASLGHADCVKYLLERGAEPNLTVEKKWYEYDKLQKNTRSITALHKAAGHLVHLRYILKVTVVGGDGEDWDKRKQALIKEFNNPYYDPVNPNNKRTNDALASIKYLLQHGAQINAKDSDGETPLSTLIKGITAPSTTFNRNINKMILTAVELLLGYGAEVNMQNKYWNEKLKKYSFKPLLHFAVDAEDLDIVKSLIEKGKAIIHSQDEYENTALLAAGKKGNLEIIDYLFSQGARLEDKNRDNETLMSISEKNNYQNVIHYLNSKVTTKLT